METIILVSGALQALSKLMGDPALGARGAAAVSILQTLSEFLKAGEAVRTELQALAAQIQLMAAENRVPTLEEWAAFKARSDAAHAIINPPTD